MFVRTFAGSRCVTSTVLVPLAVEGSSGSTSVVKRPTVSSVIGTTVLLDVHIARLLIRNSSQALCLTDYILRSETAALLSLAAERRRQVNYCLKFQLLCLSPKPILVPLQKSC